MKLCLIGFQGGGKTSVGRKIAALLSVDFFDLDECVMARHSFSSIQDAFVTLGEKKFRMVEGHCLEKIVSYPSYVVALGGGAIEALMKVPDDVHVVYLFRPFEILEAELRFPYPCWVESADPSSSLRRRWEERHPLYLRRATAGVAVEKQSVEADALKILQTLERSNGE